MANSGITLLIRNGMVIDGTGKPGYRADVAVSGDRIDSIGSVPQDAIADVEIDAAGFVVAPGFIDIHTHADIALLARPEHLPKIMQGVTTEVFTNCGLGFAPVTEAGLEIQRRYVAGLFGDDGSGNGSNSTRVDWKWRSVAEFLSRFEKQGVGANIVYLIPHGAVRVSAMGMEERHATHAELQTMVSLVEQGMEEGAWGLSTGIWYAPMRSAAREELVTLCRAAGFFATHQRDYGDAIDAATEESLEIADVAGVPVQISHLQMNGQRNEGRAPEILERLDQARRSGIDVTCDTYPYTAGSTFIQSLLPSWAVDGGPDEILGRLAASSTRARIADLLDSGGNDWSRYNLAGASSSGNLKYEGMRFDAIAAERAISPGELVCALLEEEQLRACFVQHAAHEGNVRDVLQWTGQMVGSDGLHLPGKTHPRLHGTFPRVLGKYVRETGVLSLEEAIYKMTGAPAMRLGLTDRGFLREGAAADIVLIDPETVADTATFEDPIQYPAGIPYVFVNGVAAKVDNSATGALAGRVLRRT